MRTESKRSRSFPTIGVGVAALIAGIAILAQWFGAAPAREDMTSTDALAFETAIPLGDVKGRIDHMALDLRRGRLFVAELGNDSVGIVDLSRGKVLDRLRGFKEPQGIAYVSKSDRLFIANGGSGVVEVRQGEQPSTRIGAVSLGDDADNIRLDEQGHVLVGYGDGALAVLDPSSGAKIANLSLAAHPEAFLAEPGGNRIFVNEPKALGVAVIEENSGKELARWNTLAAGNFPMALDAADHKLFVVYRLPAVMAVFDTQTGRTIDRIATCRDADDVFYDAMRHRLYVSCGEGTVAVLEADNGALHERGRVTTRRGARTAFFSPERDRLYVAAPAFNHQAAAILVFQPR